jgi:hypothetical protein
MIRYVPITVRVEHLHAIHWIPFVQVRLCPELQLGSTSMSQQQQIVYISGVLHCVTQTGWHGPFPTEHMAHKCARQKREEKGGRTVYTRIEPLGAVNIESLVEYQDPRPVTDGSQAPRGWDVVNGGAVLDERERPGAALAIVAGRTEAQP